MLTRARHPRANSSSATRTANGAPTVPPITPYSELPARHRKRRVWKQGQAGSSAALPVSARCWASSPSKSRRHPAGTVTLGNPFRIRAVSSRFAAVKTGVSDGSCSRSGIRMSSATDRHPLLRTLGLFPVDLLLGLPDDGMICRNQRQHTLDQLRPAQVVAPGPPVLREVHKLGISKNREVLGDVDLGDRKDVLHIRHAPCPFVQLRQYLEAGGVREGLEKFRPFVSAVGVHISSFYVIRRF